MGLNVYMIYTTVWLNLTRRKAVINRRVERLDYVFACVFFFLYCIALY